MNDAMTRLANLEARLAKLTQTTMTRDHLLNITKALAEEVGAAVGQVERRLLAAERMLGIGTDDESARHAIERTYRGRDMRSGSPGGEPDPQG